ncbi:MAG TPA: exodeoxyribonuclease VII small subunit [Marmoricola sp.]|nr:exodeoxyribonuclease VII small subunit [Marmoricola sp.]
MSNAPRTTPEDDQDGPEDAGTGASGLSYEEARDQLVEVVRTLEQGGTTLAESLALWERGEELARVCQEALEGARARLDRALEERGD